MPDESEKGKGGGNLKGHYESLRQQSLLPISLLTKIQFSSMLPFL